MSRRSWRFPVLTLIATARLAAGATGQQHTPTALIPREVLFGNPERTAPEISPDGTQLAYLAPVNGVLNVWVRTLGQKDDRAVTADTNRGVRNFYWQYDNRHVLYVQDVGGDENWRLYQTNITTRETRDLTPFEKVRVDIVAYDWKTPDQLLVQMNQRNPELFDVYRLDLKTGALALDTQNPGDVQGWLADNDLHVRAAQVETEDGGTVIRARNTATSDWHELLQWGPDESFGGAVGFAPGNQKLWILTSSDANATRLLEFDIATGQQAVLASDPSFDVDWVVLHPKTNALQVVTVLKQRVEYTFIDPGIKADYEVLQRVRRGDIASLSRNLDDTKWIVTYDSDDAPTYYYLYDRPARKATLLFSNRPALEQYTLSSMQPISFTARDGMTIFGYLTTPAGVEPRDLAMVVYVHGGPWYRDSWGYDQDVQWLANRGYAVLQVNFRGSTGYGKRYLNAGDRQWAGAMRTDLLDGKDWAVARGVADARKVCIMGGSYGGYATLAGLAFSPEAYTCGVDIVGPSNLNTLLQTIPPYWATVLSTFHKRMGESEAELTAQSPLFKADQIVVPLLIGQGANDPRVNKAESDQIVAAVRKHDKAVEYYVFPDEGHGFAKPQNNMAFNAATEMFLAKFLGGRAEPPTPAESALLARVRE